MSISLDDVVAVIRAHPEFSYAEMIDQAQKSNIPMDIFQQAWNRVHAPHIEKNRKLPTAKNALKWLFAYGIVGMEITLIYGARKVADLGYLPEKKPLLINLIDESSFFAVGMLLFYLSTKIFGLQGTIYKTLLLGTFFYLINKVVEAAGPNLGFLYFGIALIVFTFYILMKAYDIGVLKTIGLLLLNVLFSVLLFFVVAILVKIHLAIF